MRCDLMAAIRGYRLETLYLDARSVRTRPALKARIRALLFDMGGLAGEW